MFDNTWPDCRLWYHWSHHSVKQTLLKMAGFVWELPQCCFLTCSTKKSLISIGNYVLPPYTCGLMNKVLTFFYHFQNIAAMCLNLSLNETKTIMRIFFSTCLDQFIGLLTGPNQRNHSQKFQEESKTRDHITLLLMFDTGYQFAVEVILKFDIFTLNYLMAWPQTTSLNC